MAVDQKVAVIDHMQADETGELRGLFHRLNNELGIILSHAELLEAKCADDMSKSRAAQVVSSALDAMSTVRELRARMESNGR